MNLKKIFTVLLIYLTVLVYGSEQKILRINFTSIEPLIVEVPVGEALNVIFEESATGIEQRIVAKPTNSEIRVENLENGKKIYFTRPGEYEILFSKNPDFQKNVKIKVMSNYQFTEKEIYDIIQGGYISKNLTLVGKYVEILRYSYPESMYTKEALYDLFQLLYESMAYDRAILVGREILGEYRINNYEKEELMLSLADIYEKSGETEKSFDIYRELSLKSGNYGDILAKKYIDFGADTPKSIEFLEKHYGETLGEEIAEYLAAYYYKKDIKKAMPYYKRLGNLEKLAEIYIAVEDLEKLEDLKESMDSKTLELVKLLKEQHELEKKAQYYFETAGENLEAGKYGIAEMYYERILEASKEKNLLKKAHYKLMELFYIRGDYERALESLTDYSEKYGAQDDLEVLDYLAILNYKLQNYSESKAYFGRILEKYPKTTVARRAKIYMIKIEKN